jgi:hypothetical protein
MKHLSDREGCITNKETIKAWLVVGAKKFAKTSGMPFQDFVPMTDIYRATPYLATSQPWHRELLLKLESLAQRGPTQTIAAATTAATAEAQPASSTAAAESQSASSIKEMVRL